MRPIVHIVQLILSAHPNSLHHIRVPLLVESHLRRYKLPSQEVRWTVHSILRILIITLRREIRWRKSGDRDVLGIDLLEHDLCVLHILLRKIPSLALFWLHGPYWEYYGSP